MGKDGYETNIGKMIRIPRPQGLIAAAGSSLESYLDYLHTKAENPLAAKRLQEDILKAFTPDTPLVPTALRTPFELEANYDSFRDKNIVPYYIEEGKFPQERAVRSTSETAKFLSNKMFDLGIGLGNIPAPAKTDYAVSGFLGSSGKTGLDVMDMILNKMQGKPLGLSDREWDDLPFVRSFTIRMPESSEAFNRYYNMKKEHEIFKSSTNRAVKNENNAELLRIQNRPEYLVSQAMLKTYNQAEKAFKSIKEQIETVESMEDKDFDMAGKSRVIDAYMWTRVRIAREVVIEQARVEEQVKAMHKSK
jgi:hypothetical protein